MRKTKESDKLRTFYARDDLGKGTRGTYLTSYNKSNNLVLISPDVAEVFPTQEAVNDALRSLIRLAQESTRTAPTQARRRRQIPVVRDGSSTWREKVPLGRIPTIASHERVLISASYF